MLYVFFGTDLKKSRDAVHDAAEKFGKGRERIVITDVHTVSDLRSLLQGGGLFALKRVVVFDGILGNADMREILMEALPYLKTSDDIFFVLEEKLDAATKRHLSKYAEEVIQFDGVKTARNDNSVFGLSNALKRGDKKALWVGLMREYASDKAPEMIHGLLFWAAKQASLNSKAGTGEHSRAQKLVIELSELPHEARRHGCELEYALENFVLSHV